MILDINISCLWYSQIKIFIYSIETTIDYVEMNL